MDLIIIGLNEFAMLNGDSHCRVQPAQRRAHNPHVAGANIGLHQPGPGAGEVGTRRGVLIRPDVPGGDNGQIEQLRCGVIVSQNINPVRGGFHIGNLTGLAHLNVKARFFRLLHKKQKLIAKILPQQNARQELAHVQGRFLHAVARQMRIVLAAQPVNVSGKNRRDFNAGNIGQHQS